MNYVYYFLNKENEIIYVGKTKNIKKRMKQHFTNGHLSQECYNNVHKIMYSKVNNSQYDTEICETLLINKYKPKYNVEKVFNEQSHETSYELLNLHFQELYIYFINDEFKLSFDSIKYPCYDNVSEKEKCQNLMNYNIGNLKHKKSDYYIYNKDIIDYDEDIILKLINIYEFISKNILYEQSNTDEPINDDGQLDNTYIAFNIDILNKIIDLKLILFLINCGYIFRLNNNVYAIPLHTKPVLNNINNNYKKYQ